MNVLKDMMDEIWQIQRDMQALFIDVDCMLINDFKRAVITSSNNINMIARQLSATGKIDEVNAEHLKVDSAAMREGLQKLIRMLNTFSECEEHSRNCYWYE